MAIEDRIAAALQELDEFGYVHVYGLRTMAMVAEAARRSGRQIKVEPMLGGWWSIEEVVGDAGDADL